MWNESQQIVNEKSYSETYCGYEGLWDISYESWQPTYNKFCPYVGIVRVFWYFGVFLVIFFGIV